ncbi:MAG: helix-turn-helix domain-containing protein, partial [Trebonia sp.]
MPSQELIDRVAELRGQGRTPKEIARALGLKPAEVTPLIRAVGAAAPRLEAPVTGCWVSDNWSEGLTISGHHPDWPGTRPVGTDTESGLMGVLVAREHGSSVSAAGFLVDLWCMGVKDTHGPKTMDRRKLPAFTGRFFGAFSQPPVPAPLDLARHVVFGAVDYARGLGLEPYQDFAKCAGHLGEWTG